jgi:hypothetical protein
LYLKDENRDDKDIQGWQMGDIVQEMLDLLSYRYSKKTSLDYRLSDKTATYIKKALLIESEECYQSL